MEKEIEINGLRTHYSETGNPDGAPVLIMHGWGCDHTTVASIARILEPGMRVVSVDLPGHGQSAEPPEAWGVYQFADQMERFIRAVGLERPALIGHSFGGRVSIVLGSRGVASKIMLVDSAGIKPRHSLKYHIKVKSFKVAKKLLPLLLGRERGQKAIDAWRGKAGSADYRQSSPRMRDVMSRCVNEDLKDIMPRVGVPTLLVWGEADTATPISDARTMERLIPDAGLVSFPGCGHYSFLDNPMGFRAVTREFFKNELKNPIKK